jgi:hypothetical protein
MSEKSSVTSLAMEYLVNLFYQLEKMTMFKKPSVSLRAAALKSEAKAQRELAKAQTDQAKAVRQLELADQMENEEVLTLLTKDATASRLLYSQSSAACGVAVNELEKAEALLLAAKKNVSFAEEARQAASVESNAARKRVENAKETLQKASQ